MAAPLAGLLGRQPRVFQLLHQAPRIGRHVVKALAQLCIAQHQRLARSTFQRLALVQGFAATFRSLPGGAGLALGHQRFQREQRAQRTGAQQARNQQEREQQQLLEGRAVWPWRAGGASWAMAVGAGVRR